ncbi:MAG: NAD(P)H:quinone oxidoreductase [Arenicella sp.]|nr:NAD(P)H:quinone oxidoreductase [Arenicella sp.]
MNTLIVYDSRLGSVQKMARLIARGVESVEGCNAVVRCVPSVSIEPKEKNQPEYGDLFVELADLEQCDALIIGSPTRFGNMSASMKYFLDGTSSLWLTGSLSGIPAAVFTSSSSMHGGQESTLLSMLNPLLHHGMLLCGLPYTEHALSKTTTGGTPYGASHVAGPANSNPISDDEKALCIALGKRVSGFGLALKNA